MSAYTRWIHHGEAPDAEVIEGGEEVVPHAGDDYDSLVHLGEDEQDDDDEVTEMIADLYKAVEEDGESPMFAKVLADAKRPLCPRSQQSRFSFLVRLLYIKSRYRVGNTAFDALMKLLSSGFPQCQFPDSYDEAKKYIRVLGLRYESIHVCKNNCVLFRKSEVFEKDYEKLEVCPICVESR
jgi:hypothetical protein